jgi:hypothetical protein
MLRSDLSGWVRLGEWVAANPTKRFVNTGSDARGEKPFIEARSRLSGEEPYVCGEGATLWEAANELARKLKLA